MKLKPMIPDSPARVRELLLEIFDGQRFLRFAGVNTQASSFDIVWSPQAEAARHDSVFVPLKSSRLAEAQQLIEHLLSQIQLGLPPSEMAAEQLYELLDKRPVDAGGADRPAYDRLPGPTPESDLQREAEPPPGAAPRDLNELT